MKQLPGSESWMEKYVVGPLRKVVGKEPPGPLKLIISGGSQDDWHTHQLDRYEHDVAPDVERIKIGRYNLDLVARVNSEGLAEEVKPSGDPNTLEMKTYLYIFRILRPTTILTEDKRIYHDRTLFEGCNAERLNSLLEVLMEEYSGDFEERYKMLMSGVSP
ncbi:hypothetical protein ACFL96_09260 [Thermoproteota archaeon]